MKENRFIQPLSKETIINLLGFIVLLGFTIGVFYHYGTRSYPKNTFLFRTEDRFMDYLNPYNMMTDPYSQNAPTRNYLPFSYIVSNCLGFFKLISARSSLRLFLLGFIIFFLRINRSQFTYDSSLNNKTFLFILTFLTYPFLFAVDRGNLELVVFLSLYLFLHFYYKDNMRLSLLFLSFAIAMKLFPATFLLLLLSDKKFKESIYVVMLTITLTILSFLALPGGFTHNIQTLLENLKLYNQVYAAGNEGLYFGNSLFGMVKFINIVYLGRSEGFFRLFQPYAVFSGAFFFGIAVFIFYKKT